MAKKVILGTDIARDAFKTKVNENFTELYDKDVALGESINDLAPDAVELSLLNGWTAATAGFYGLAVKKVGNLVNIKGHIKDGTITKGTTIATLPEGYKPYQDLRGDARQFGNPCIIRMCRINRTGSIAIDGNYDWVAGVYDIDITYPIS